MLELSTLIDQLAGRAPLIVLVVFVAAAAESVIGLGAVVPGETVLVVAAVVLAGTPWLLAAVVAGWLGAWTADHVGFVLGRSLGPRMPGTWAVRKLGTDRWRRALRLVRGHSIGVLVVARILPAVRTLVSAAAGAAQVPYPLFAVTTAAAGLLWSGLWVLGGAAVGHTLVAAGDRAGILVLGVLAALGVVAVVRNRIRASPEQARPDDSA